MNTEQLSINPILRGRKLNELTIWTGQKAINEATNKAWYKKILQHIDCSFKRAIKTNRQLTFEIRIRLYYELSGIILFASNNHLISFDQYTFIYNKLFNLL